MDVGSWGVLSAYVLPDIGQKPNQKLNVLRRMQA